MSTDAAALPNDVAACHALIAQQFSTIDDLQHKLTQLEHYVAQLVRARFGPRSERLDPNQLTLFVATAMEVPPSAQGVVETAVQAHSRRGGGRNEFRPNCHAIVSSMTWLSRRSCVQDAANAASGSIAKLANNWSSSRRS